MNGPCPICAFFGHAGDYHPKPNSLLGEVLHAALAGMSVKQTARRLVKSDSEIYRALRELRRNGALPMVERGRGRPRNQQRMAA